MHVGVERQPPSLRRAAANGGRGARRRRAAAARRGAARRRARRYTGPWVYGVATASGSTRWPAASTTCLRARPHHPRRPRPVMLNTWEAVYFDHDLGRLTALADAAAEVGRRAVRARRRLVPAPPRRRRRARRLVRRRGRLARRAAPAGRRTSRGLGHAVRAVGRAGDGQPRLRPRPRPPGLDPRAPAAGPPPPSRHQQVLDLGRPRGVRLPPGAARRAAHRVPDRLPQVGPQPRPASTPAPAGRRAGRARARPLAVYRLLDELRAPAPRRGDRVLLLRRRAGRPRHPRAHRPGLGQRHHRPARAPADPALDRAAAAAGAGRRHVGAAARAHHRPHARRWRSAPAPRCSATSASSGT